MEIGALWPFGRHRRARAEQDEGAPAAPPQPPADGEVDRGVAEELAARRAEIARMEEQALRESESLKVRASDLERRAQALEDRERNVEQQAEELKRAKRVQRRELEQISSLSAAQAKQLLIKEVEEEARHQAGLNLRRIEEQTKQDAERRARSILAVAMQRLAATHASETTTRLVELPNDEMKGRIIGRDGRNIRALESLTGVDFIIDETPSAVVLSSFDGVRREVARLTLEKLIADGRIHPALCEEMYEQAKAEVETMIAEEGERAVLEANVHPLDPELLALLGQLRYRTSYGQNVLDHLVECAHLAGLLAEELGASVETGAARRPVARHRQGGDSRGRGLARAGGRQARAALRRGRGGGPRDGSPPRGGRAAHRGGGHRADRRRGLGRAPRRRGEALEQYVTRLRDLEEIASRHSGVHKVFAMRAGREIRVMVDPGEVDDDSAALISHEIASAIEKEMEYPGGSRSR